MPTHILYLSFILMAIAIYPGGMLTMSASYVRGKVKDLQMVYLSSANIYFLIFIGMIAIGLPFYETISFKLDWYWAAGAILLSPILVLMEFQIGKLVLFIKNRKIKNLKLSVSGTWVNRNAVFWLLTFSLAILEELMFRQIWAYFLMDIFQLPVWVFIAVSAFLYALNHLYLGDYTFWQKLVTGAVFSAIFVLSGRSLLVPVLAHVFQNISILILERKLSHA